MENKRDILILGGKPSGLFTILHLVQIAAHLAPRILILKKAHDPRLKLCAADLQVIARGCEQRTTHWSKRLK